MVVYGRIYFHFVRSFRILRLWRERRWPCSVSRFVSHCIVHENLLGLFCNREMTYKSKKNALEAKQVLRSGKAFHLWTLEKEAFVNRYETSIWFGRRCVTLPRCICRVIV